MIVNIDISENEDAEVTVGNTHGFSYAIGCGELTLEINFDQAQTIYSQLKRFLDDEVVDIQTSGSTK